MGGIHYMAELPKELKLYNPAHLTVMF